MKKDTKTIMNSRFFPFQGHTAGSSKARGTEILIGKSLRYQEQAACTDSKGRLVMTKGLLNNVKVTIVSIYAPNEGQVAFLEEVFKKITLFGEGILMVAGDLNYVVDLQVDRMYKQGLNKIFNTPLFTSLHNLFERYIIDCWRQLYPHTRDYTYFSGKHKVHTRLDYFLLSAADMDKVQKAEIELNTLSDHNPVSCELLLANIERKE